MTGLPAVALALLFLALGAVLAWDRALLRGARSPRALELRAADTAVVVLANGETLPVRALRGIGVTRHWVALAALRPAGRSMMVTSGMLGPEKARVLRLWALWGKTPGVAVGQRLA
jgi:hypothetical protein